MDPTEAAAPSRMSEAGAPLRRRNSCYDVVKRFGKNAWRKFGGMNRHSRENGPQLNEPPIESVVVDEDTENTPPQRDERFGSGPLEVDPNEANEFTFEVPPQVYSYSASSQDRITALCAKYGLPHDPDLERPTPYSNTPSGRLRVPKRTRQRVRVTCHVCNSFFKGDKTCQKCQHRKCSECRRHNVTEPRSSSDKSSVFVADDDSMCSDNDKSTESSKDSDSRPLSPITPDVDITEVEGSQPVIEKSKHVCHKCNSEFPSLSNPLCGACGHEKCNRCSRVVIHVSYPYDPISGTTHEQQKQLRVYRPSRQRVRFYCDHCGVMFASHTKICRECLHQRCKNCPRHPGKRRRVESGSIPSQSALRNVEARMADISLPTASTSATRDQMIQ